MCLSTALDMPCKLKRFSFEMEDGRLMPMYSSIILGICRHMNDLGPGGQVVGLDASLLWDTAETAFDLRTAAVGARLIAGLRDSITLALFTATFCHMPWTPSIVYGEA